ncbi:Ribosomal lysine N-methyltransferase 4 [Neophaeococcomyces mojaviensis]|uniref:Ribosomal lysine N-methyltransferase 4 n=1 Tax=Neophaeococcomyces mojaviensis TaxID=3383035 RepID=A0ACC3ABI0_9EURO|nr:Ribosomal lysine N-methyltransferase 4 [Knufia sp. JES_112]
MAEQNREFEAKSSSFLTWFSSLPGTAFHSSLRVTDLRQRHAGRGIIATTDIPAETELFTIPRSAIISVATSDLAQKLPELFDQPASHTSNASGRSDEGESDDNALDIPSPWLNLIFVLLYEYLHYDTSKWKPYLEILPTRPSEFNTLMFWDSSELQELQASHITSRIGRSTADIIFRRRVIPIIREHANIFYPTTTSTRLSDEELLNLAHSMGSLIMSYAFELQPDDDEENEDDEDNDDAQDGWKEDKAKEGTMGMIPMADILNADAEFNAHLSHGDSALTMTSLGIKAGNEVLNYYGPLSNGELIRRYGYSSQNHARYDIVELPWLLVKSCILRTLSKQAGPTETQLRGLIQKVEDENDLTNESFVLEREADGPDDTGHCTSPAVFRNPPEELVDIIVIEIICKASSKKIGPSEQKKRFLPVFLEILRARLAQYATSIAEDEKLIPQATGRLKMAIDVRYGEKKLIQEAIDWTEGKLRALTVETITNDAREGPPQKKQKKAK